VASVEAQALKPSALRARFAPPTTSDALAEPPAGERINIYIENNQL
jgi:hypothetical protein